MSTLPTLAPTEAETRRMIAKRNRLMYAAARLNDAERELHGEPEAIEIRELRESLKAKAMEIDQKLFQG